MCNIRLLSGRYDITVSYCHGVTINDGNDDDDNDDIRKAFFQCLIPLRGSLSL